jgi:uncharacterized protein YjiS (DUF1127 family)
MTRSAAHETTFPGAIILGQSVRWLVSLFHAFQDRREVMNLAELDERMLKDIGLTRGDVIGALAEPIHHNPSWVLVRCVERHKPASRPAPTRQARPVVQLVNRV